MTDTDLTAALAEESVRDALETYQLGKAISESGIFAMARSGACTVDNEPSDQNTNNAPESEVKVLTAVFTYVDPATVQHVFDSNKKVLDDQELGLPALGVSAVSLSDELVRLELIEDVVETNPHNLDEYDRIEIVKAILSKVKPSRDRLADLYKEYTDD